MSIEADLAAPSCHHSLPTPSPRYLQLLQRTSPTKVAGMTCLSSTTDRLTGLVVRESDSGAEDPGFESRLQRDFCGSRHTSDFNIATPVATLPGAWHYMSEL